MATKDMTDAPPVPLPPRVVPSHLAEHEDDENGKQRGYVRGTDYSLPYYSRWSRMHDLEVYEDLLRHVNCGYLSTHGVPPTLLALKQHAQSLCVLIQALNPTLRAGELVAGDPTKLPAGGLSDLLGNLAAGAPDSATAKHELNDAFDFLQDLFIPYTNPDPNHAKPLIGLVNEVKARHEAHGTTYHCPLDTHVPRGATEPQKPYANHQALLSHANALLERLDHETASTGGLLSLLPTTEEHDADAYTASQNSLLGQWLLFTQHLVTRGHALEQQLSNALDVLASEAAIPAQYIGTLGAGAVERPVAVAAQDRFILANAGDDVFEHLHGVLDKQEALAQEKERVWAKQGVVGRHIYRTQRGGDEYARGLVGVTVPTRYYRLAGQGRNAIFVVPAWESHPGTQGTRDAERKPAVVACVQPRFPERATALEKRYEERIERAKGLEVEVLGLRAEERRAFAEKKALEEENRQLAETRDALLLSVGKEEAELAEDVQRQRDRAMEAEMEMAKMQEEMERMMKDKERLRLQLDEAMKEAALLRSRR